MKIPVIKKLVEEYSIQQLLEAENALLEEKSPAIEIDGDDEGEKLTHVIAAGTILQDMQKSNIDFKDALRNYTKKVRESIN